jgi:hypothetical protein
VYAHPNTSLFFSDKSEGKGTLYLTDRFALRSLRVLLTWRPAEISSG